MRVVSTRSWRVCGLKKDTSSTKTPNQGRTYGGGEGPLGTSETLDFEGFFREIYVVCNFSECLSKLFCYVGRPRKFVAWERACIRLLFRTLLAKIYGKNIATLEKIVDAPLHIMQCQFKIDSKGSIGHSKLYLNFIGTDHRPLKILSKMFCVTLY